MKKEFVGVCYNNLTNILCLFNGVDSRKFVSIVIYRVAFG